MTVNDTIKKSFFNYPTLYMGSNIDDIKRSVLHHYLIVLGNGIEWANTKDKKKGGYLTEPNHHNRKRTYDKPYGKEKIAENIEDYISPNVAHELIEIDHDDTKKFMGLFGSRRKSVYISQKLRGEEKLKKTIFIESEYHLLPPNTMMPGDKYSEKYKYALREFKDLTRGSRETPYPNFSEQYSCFYEPGVEYIQDDWREESIKHLEYWEQYFQDEERIKTFSDYPKKGQDDILKILKKQILEENKDENYVFKNYGFRKFDLNDPIAFEMAKVEKFNRNRKEMMEFIEKTIYKLQK